MECDRTYQICSRGKLAGKHFRATAAEHETKAVLVRILQHEIEPIVLCSIPEGIDNTGTAVFNDSLSDLRLRARLSAERTQLHLKRDP